MNAPPPERLDRNPALVCLIRAMQMALFPMAILTVFLERQIGFGVTQIMVLQGVFGLAMVLFEFPSGYLADRLGYRRCLIFAFSLWTIAWPIYGYAQSWIGVASAELLLGVGMALISGCDTALVYESLLARGREHEFIRWSGRLTFSGQLAEGLAALAAGVLFAIGVALPFLAQALASAIALIVALMLVEPARERPGFADGLAQIRAMVRYVARESPELRGVFLVAVVLGMASFLPVWTIQLYALDAGVPEPWLGPIWAVANFSVASAALLSQRVFGSRSLALIVGVCTTLIVVGYLGLGLSHALWGFGFYYLLTIMRGLKTPAVEHHEQRLVPSRDRAGLVSLRSMVFRVGFLALGPAVGWAVDRHGQHPIMLVLAGGFAVAGVLVALIVRRSGAPS
jgi:MFS family permease